MNIDENAVTNKVIATLLDNRSFEIKLNLPKPLIFETFEEKIQRDLSKDEVKELLRFHYTEIINYTKYMKNISGFDSEIINNVYNYYNTQIHKYTNTQISR